MTYMPFNEGLYQKHTVSLDIPTDNFFPSIDYSREVDVMPITIPKEAISPMLYVESEDVGYNSYVSNTYFYDSNGEKYYPLYVCYFIDQNPAFTYKFRNDIAVGFLKGKTTTFGFLTISENGNQPSEGVRILSVTLTYYLRVFVISGGGNHFLYKNIV